MSLEYDLFWSFRSPYSYFVTKRLLALGRDYDVKCNLRIVYPIAVRQPEFFDNNDPLWVQYFMRDVFRTAQYLDLPFRWPNPDPVVMDYATRTYPKEQPHIFRLSHLGQAAVELGKGLEFIDEVGSLIWGGQLGNWLEGDKLAEASSRAGIDFSQLEAMVATKSQEYHNIIEASQIAQRAAGHYGVPLMAFNGEPFFGQDRFDQLKWRMEQKGLESAP